MAPKRGHQPWGTAPIPSCLLKHPLEAGRSFVAERCRARAAAVFGPPGRATELRRAPGPRALMKSAEELLEWLPGTGAVWPGGGARTPWLEHGVRLEAPDFVCSVVPLDRAPLHPGCPGYERRGRTVPCRSRCRANCSLLCVGGAGSRARSCVVSGYPAGDVPCLACGPRRIVL